MNRPIIGLTTYTPAEKEGYFIQPEYVNGVRRADAVPVLLPPCGIDNVEPWLDRIQGLVLIGGGDIDPAYYRGGGHDSIYNIDPHRDGTEMALLKLALARRMPILAICRGMQMLNVVLGGSLHLHLPDVYGESVLHRLPPRNPTPHDIRVEPDSHLARILGQTHLHTASWHHQAVDRLGKGLRAVARAEDGVVEAVELAHSPHLMAVQWHPELTAAEDAGQQALFDTLARLARAY